MKNKVSVSTFKKMKENKNKITMLTAYDYSMAKIVDESGIDSILVGDSLGMVFQGNDTTLQVTVDDMIYHCKAVSKGAKRALIIGDMPFLSYHINVEDSVRNAGRIVQEGKVEAVKIEGGKEMADVIYGITRAKIPVMGHLGLTPQSVNIFGGFKAQGKEINEINKLIEDAKALQDAGAFSIVLEAVPPEVAKIVTESINIPTIGIGAGVNCDGQVLVINDMLGLYSNFTPKFVKKYANLHESIKEGIGNYIDEVKNSKFPNKEHTFSISMETLENLKDIY